MACLSEEGLPLDPRIDPRLEGLAALLDSAVAARISPGFCLAWARRTGPVRVLAAGATALEGFGVPVFPAHAGTVFDLASLTKPLCTSAAAMLLSADGQLDPEAKVSSLLEGWSGPTRNSVRVRHLLAHESGLVWWRPFYLELAGAEDPRRALRQALFDLEPLTAPGARSVYSDPGFLLLDEVLRACALLAPGALVRARLWQPWGLGLGFVALDPSLAEARQPHAQGRAALLASAQVAATELCPWRGRVLHGEVHDENAAFLGGIAPHAGLFGSVRDVLGFGLGLLRALADEDRLGATLRRFFEGGELGLWSWGWDRPSPGASSAGRLVSASARGHLGFTGTSLWIDPERDAAVALLANRVHPSRQDTRLRELRPQIHDQVWALLDR